jgi:hypothetical protein
MALADGLDSSANAPLAYARPQAPSASYRPGGGGYQWILGAAALRERYVKQTLEVIVKSARSQR